MDASGSGGGVRSSCGRLVTGTTNTKTITGGSELIFLILIRLRQARWCFDVERWSWECYSRPRRSGASDYSVNGGDGVDFIISVRQMLRQQLTLVWQGLKNCT